MTTLAAPTSEANDKRAEGPYKIVAPHPSELPQIFRVTGPTDPRPLGDWLGISTATQIRDALNAAWRSGRDSPAVPQQPTEQGEGSPAVAEITSLSVRRRVEESVSIGVEGHFVSLRGSHD